MPRVAVNGIELEVDVRAGHRPTPVVMIMGLGVPLTYWEDGFCDRLAARGHSLVRFDNRDVGKSSWLEELGVPDVVGLMSTALGGERVQAPYVLSDMAADVVGLLDALEIEAAHVMGISMGGMIAQTVAIEHPTRVRTLTSIMSTTGDRDLPTATPEAMQVLFRPAPREREANIAHRVASWRVLAGDTYPADEQRIRRLGETAYDRGFHPEGVARQLAAIIASGSRREALREVRAPTLVLHGDADPLIRVEAGRDTAAQIPGARLVELEGMGHEMPPALWPRIVDEIDAHLTR